jgi:hypothetical protein
MMVDDRGSVVIEGLASPGEVVTANGSSMTVGDDGHWSFRLERTAGTTEPTEMRVEARSADGRSRSAVTVRIG